MRAWLALVFTVTLGVRAFPASADEAGAESFPALSATFETVVRSDAGVERRRWRLLRNPARVDYEWLDEDWVDIWRAGVGDGLSLVKLAETDRTLIEYSEGQLRALRASPTWRELNAVLPADPRAMGLRHTGTRRLFGQPAESYTGKRAGQAIRLIWLARDRLPYRLVVKQGRRTTRLQIRSLALGPTPVRGARELSGYRRLDGADLGDLESDPFVQRHDQRLHLHARR
jgi:hypothetical protein